MKNKLSMEKLFKSLILGIIMLLFLISLPAVFLNDKKTNKVKDEIKVLLNVSFNICNDACIDYPIEWAIEGKKKEIELYCKNQCINYMTEIRKEIAKNITLNELGNKYNQNVERIYCILGLRCFPGEIKDFIYNYQPSKN